MKKATFSIIIIFLVSIGYSQEKNEQLYLVGEEVVKPEMDNQYKEFSKELAELCKEENFPYSYQIWVTGFSYSLWYVIESYDDVYKIEEAWETIIEKWGIDKYKSFKECIEYTEDRFFALLPDLFYEPENPSLKDDDATYCYWQNLYVKKGHEKEVEANFQKGNNLLKEYSSSMAGYIGIGKIGYEKPVYSFWQFGKSKYDFFEQQKKDAEKAGEEIEKKWQEINNELIKHMRKFDSKDFWYVKDISYEAVKE